jgi:hypothetical protein
MVKKNDVLLSPGFLTGLLVLLANDFFFKDYFHNALTGKLSDIAGLFIFPLFISVILRSQSKLIFFGVAVFFIYWKSPLSDGLLNGLSFLSGLHFQRVVDYSDLLCLPVLIGSYKYMISEHVRIYFPRIIILFCSAFAFIATSPRREAYAEIRYAASEGYDVITPRKPLFINLNRFETSYIADDSIFNWQRYEGDTLIVHIRSNMKDLHPSVFVLKDFKNGNIRLVKVLVYKSKELNEQKWFDLLNTVISKRHLAMQIKREYEAKMDSLIKLTLSYHHDKQADDELFLIDTVLKAATPDLISERQLYELKADILIAHYGSAYKKEILMLLHQQDVVDSTFQRSSYSTNRYSKRLDFYDLIRKDSIKNSSVKNANSSKQ